MSIPSTIKLSGAVYIKYRDESNQPALGDILLLLNDDAITLMQGDYENLKTSGYIKAKVFDGMVWQNINIGEFCHERENKFTKRQRALDSALLCRTIMIESKGAVLHKTYRGHFTLEEYEQAPYIRRGNRDRRK